MSNATSALPTYLYKLVPPDAAPSDPLPEELPLSNLDQDDGFIHLSVAAQVLGTLKRFFADEEKMYILKIPFHSVEKNIRWESPDGKVRESGPGEGLFPHLYNGRLGKEEVEEVIELERGSDWDTLENAGSRQLID